jgi:hypothetical protein
MLDIKFTTKNICDNVVKIEDNDDITFDADTLADMDEDSNEYVNVSTQSKLTAASIKDYVISLRDAVEKWYSTWFPESDASLSDDEKLWLDRLNRIGISYFRPLVTAALLTKADTDEKIALFKAIERFIFIVFRCQTTRSNYRSSEFYGDARKLLSGEITIQQIIDDLNSRMSYTFYIEDDTVYYDMSAFHDLISRKFDYEGSGYYGWGCRWYFLYEYELYLAELNGSRRLAGSWQQFVKSANNRVTIEHIYPQTPTDSYWTTHFKDISEEDMMFYQGSIGNLLLLSQSINSSLQNDGFDAKKKRKEDENGNVLRLGYENGSYSEVEVSKLSDWTPEAIEERGMSLMRFMAERWDLNIKDESELKAMLFLPEAPVEAPVTSPQ